MCRLKFPIGLVVFIILVVVCGQTSAAALKPAVRSLSLKEAMELGLKNSRMVQSATYNLLQVEQDYQKSRTIYDPAVFMVSAMSNTERPTESTLDGVPIRSALEEERWQVQAGIKNRLPTGGSLSLYQEANRLASTSEFVTPNPQYKTKIVASLTQPLLKGIGDKEGSTSIEVAELNQKIARSALAKDTNDTLVDIASSYWQLHYELNVIRINQASLERAQEVYRREQSRSTQGLSRSVDVDRALSAFKTRQSNLLRSKNQARATMRQLWLQISPATMVVPGQVPDIRTSEIPVHQFLDEERRKILAHALIQRQELAIARDTVQINRKQQSLASHNRLPVLDLRLDYGYNGLDNSQEEIIYDPYNDDYNDWRVELAFEWPLGGRSAAAEKRKADFRLMQSKVDMRFAAERVALEVDLVLDELHLAQEELEATHDAMKSAERVMAGEEIMFELGQKDNQDLLTVQDYYGAAQKDYYQALSRFNLNLVTLSRVRGTLLRDYGLQPAFADLRQAQLR